ncbi:ABC transporter substrate-binding protein [Allopontixanthobacter sp.]|uniref:ABC transporter substrate-binding protein n=1 Tax=Allopontixanthobacter sp. TaxID=2906452 RepID=UPI002ABA6A8E|nr:ABC transporter substrate-binding protein [Allopontixanthobacter sp.]MDZ4307157.1 ABC transporter substrate-binding protein [Allopontixanthobacter sp.]
MSLDQLNIGFLPLVDAALPILAQEHGFAEQEGLHLNFIRDVSWASVLDRLLYGQTDMAHMLAPLAIAATLGRGRPAKAVSVPFVLGLNGNAITVSLKLAAALAEPGLLGEPYSVGKRLKDEIARRATLGERVKFGVVHRYSSHNYKLRYWLSECGIAPDSDVDIVTIPPPFAADALASSEVDAICVGEPWNSVAVERGVGQIVLVTAQIWRRGVEKVLAMPADRLEGNRDLAERMVRALHRAAEHFVDQSNWDTNAALLARSQYLDGSPKLILRAISDQLLLASGTDPVHVPDFMFQYREAANFPWVSQAAWIYSQMLRWDHLDYNAADQTRAEQVFRPDVYRKALTGLNTPIPGANAKVEGGVSQLLGAGSSQGRLILGADPFFDHRVFDPTQLKKYLSALPNP